MGILIVDPATCSSSISEPFSPLIMLCLNAVSPSSNGWMVQTYTLIIEKFYTAHINYSCSYKDINDD